MPTLEAMAALRCAPCRGEEHRVDAARVTEMLAFLPGWERSGDGIAKTFEFKNYHHTMAFVNAVAWIAHREDHHPDLEVGYNRCRVFYSTHDVGGLSENDFICAARVESLL
jgi:4a-hydroxytetrahydrobiopterin dehydratase